MNTVNKFTERLDEIFAMGNPTKALIIDAFIVATETPISPEPPLPQVLFNKSEPMSGEELRILRKTASRLISYPDKLENFNHPEVLSTIVSTTTDTPQPEKKEVTDEEIWSVAKEDYPNETIHDDENKKNTLRQKLFVIGATWMRDQMKSKEENK